MKPCCSDWADATCGLLSIGPSAFGYPAAIRPDAQIVPHEDGTWSIMGCCGGGCAVVTDVRFCPYCGSKVVVEAVADVLPAT